MKKMIYLVFLIFHVVSADKKRIWYIEMILLGFGVQEINLFFVFLSRGK